ncbi:MAG TPA: DUF3006 domain-containing protein [Longimicrobiaceae bacterium]|nr:DUF3006 domain-containing protein [Longimicrobiaceae bacterium]
MSADVHRMVVDRFEGDLAVVDVEGQMLDLPRWMLPEVTREGDVLRVSVSTQDDERLVAFRVSAEETHAAKEKARAALDRLRDRNLPGAG